MYDQNWYTELNESMFSRDQVLKSHFDNVLSANRMSISEIQVWLAT